MIDFHDFAGGLRYDPSRHTLLTNHPVLASLRARYPQYDLGIYVSRRGRFVCFNWLSRPSSSCSPSTGRMLEIHVWDSLPGVGEDMTPSWEWWDNRMVDSHVAYERTKKALRDQETAERLKQEQADDQISEEVRRLRRKGDEVSAKEMASLLPHERVWCALDDADEQVAKDFAKEASKKVRVAV